MGGIFLSLWPMLLWHGPFLLPISQRQLRALPARYCQKLPILPASPKNMAPQIVVAGFFPSTLTLTKGLIATDLQLSPTKRSWHYEPMFTINSYVYNVYKMPTFSPLPTLLIPPLPNLCLQMFTQRKHSYNPRQLYLCASKK